MFAVWLCVHCILFRIRIKEEDWTIIIGRIENPIKMSSRPDRDRDRRYVRDKYRGHSEERYDVEKERRERARERERERDRKSRVWDRERRRDVESDDDEDDVLEIVIGSGTGR